MIKDYLNEVEFRNWHSDKDQLLVFVRFVAKKGFCVFPGIGWWLINEQEIIRPQSGEYFSGKKKESIDFSR